MLGLFQSGRRELFDTAQSLRRRKSGQFPRPQPLIESNCAWQRYGAATCCDESAGLLPGPPIASKFVLDPERKPLPKKDVPLLWELEPLPDAWKASADSIDHLPEGAPLENNAPLESESMSTLSTFDSDL